jgi:hypothetical protein
MKQHWCLQLYHHYCQSKTLKGQELVNLVIRVFTLQHVRLLGTKFKATNCISEPVPQEPYTDIFWTQPVATSLLLPHSLKCIPLLVVFSALVKPHCSYKSTWRAILSHAKISRDFVKNLLKILTSSRHLQCHGRIWVLNFWIKFATIRAQNASKCSH